LPWSSDNRPIIVPPSTESLGKRNHDLRNRSTGVYQQYRGIAYQQKGLYDRAIEDFTKVIELKPDEADAYNHRGYANAAKRLHDQAIQDFSQAIKLNPQHTTAYVYRGRVYELLGREGEAVRDFKHQYEMGSRSEWLVQRLRELGALN